MNSTVTWKDGMAFEADVGGYKLTLDADPSFGGQNLGPTPKPLLLTSLAGCTAMDVISMLTKMRLQVDHFSVDAEATLSDDHPKVPREIVVTYVFEGANLPLKKLRKAINLSVERYCGVNATLRSASAVESITYRMTVNGEQVPIETEE